MKRTSISLLSATALALVTALPGSGQAKLAEGTWTGLLIPPESEVVGEYVVEYVVSYGDGGLEVELVLPPDTGMGTIVASQLVFDGDSLEFVLEVGVSVFCSLGRQSDGHYEGECNDPSGVRSGITMFPPAR